MHPASELGLSFQPGVVESGYLSWARLPELLPVSFPGVKTSRDDVVVDIDKERLVSRMEQYFDPELGDAEIRAIMPTAMTSVGGFDARKTRRFLIQRGFKPENIVRIVTGRLTFVGFIGSWRPHYSIGSAKNISRRCLRGTSGSAPDSTIVKTPSISHK